MHDETAQADYGEQKAVPDAEVERHHLDKALAALGEYVGIVETRLTPVLRVESELAAAVDGTPTAVSKVSSPMVDAMRDDITRVENITRRVRVILDRLTI